MPEPSEEVYVYAKQFIADLIASGQEWPEDEWHEIATGWDLNLSGSELRLAHLYPVIDGNTDTSRWFTV